MGDIVVVVVERVAVVDDSNSIPQYSFVKKQIDAVIMWPNVKNTVEMVVVAFVVVVVVDSVVVLGVVFLPFPNARTNPYIPW